MYGIFTYTFGSIFLVGGLPCTIPGRTTTTLYMLVYEPPIFGRVYHRKGSPSIFDKWWQQLPGAMLFRNACSTCWFSASSPSFSFSGGNYSTKNQTKFTKHMAKTNPHIIPRSFELESSINDPSICLRYCWWTKSCTTYLRLVVYPITFYIPGGSPDFFHQQHWYSSEH